MTFKGIALCCPHCRGGLERADTEATALQCTSCARTFPVVLGIPDLRAFPDPYIDPEEDRAKGRRVGARLDDLTFAELIAFYYSITDVVPPRHARQYTRGLLAGEARAKASLASWQQALGPNNRPATRLLDVGCGTAPLLAAAAPQFPTVVGVDIAFRWLVVAKKRLAEAGVDAPLICACAEALPFPDGTFDRVVLDSVIEHVRDQHDTLQECQRVMQPGGVLFATTPNRFSLGPDPHTGLWAGSLLPDRWTAAYVRRMGGVPPKRRLLSARTLTRRLREAGFHRPQVMLPDIAPEQRAQFSGLMKHLIDAYQTAKRWPVTRQVLHGIGPLLQAVAQKHA